MEVLPPEVVEVPPVVEVVPLLVVDVLPEVDPPFVDVDVVPDVLITQSVCSWLGWTES